MIQQISPVKNQTAALPGVSRELLEVRLIQNRIKSARDGQFWSPITPGPYLVPANLWFD